MHDELGLNTTHIPVPTYLHIFQYQPNYRCSNTYLLIGIAIGYQYRTNYAYTNASPITYTPIPSYAYTYFKTYPQLHIAVCTQVSLVLTVLSFFSIRIDNVLITMCPCPNINGSTLKIYPAWARNNFHLNDVLNNILSVITISIPFPYKVA